MTATCTGTTTFACTISKSTSSTASTTFTISGNTVTTADGDSYDFCVNDPKLTYKGKSAGAEDGQWTLEKR